MRSRCQAAALEEVALVPVGPVVLEGQAVSSDNSFRSSTKTETNA